MLNALINANLVHLKKSIRFKNDIEYPVAEALAVEVISETPFEPISEKTYERAAALLKSCQSVVCCLTEFGTMNEKNRLLAELGRGEKGGK